MINNTDKEIKLKANTKKITIEIPTEFLIRVFFDSYEGEVKIKNKKKFREKFANHIREILEVDTIQEVVEMMTDEEDCVKCI